MIPRHIYLVVEINEEGYPHIDKAFIDENKAYNRQHELVEKNEGSQVHVGCIELIE